MGSADSVRCEVCECIITKERLRFLRETNRNMVCVRCSTEQPAREVLLRSIRDRKNEK